MDDRTPVRGRRRLPAGRIPPPRAFRRPDERGDRRGFRDILRGDAGHGVARPGCPAACVANATIRPIDLPSPLLTLPQRNRILLLAITGAVLACAPFVSGALSSRSGTLVETAVVTARSLRPSVLSSGRIAHEDEVNLTAEVLGKVEAVHVEEGQSVRRGDLVLAVDSRAYAADVLHQRSAVHLEEIDIERRQARIANLERQLERSRRLFEEDLLDAHSLEVLGHEFDLARIDLRSTTERLQQARARLEQAESRLERTHVRAPIDGVVTALDIEIGETAIPSSTNIPGSRLMTIADPARLIAEVHVDEADIAAIQVGQPAEIVAVAHPDRPLSGVVEFVANTAKTEEHRRGRSFLTRIRVTPTDGFRLRPGMSCRAEIFTQAGQERLTVPIQAIVTAGTAPKDTREFVFVARGSSARQLPVVTGQSDDTYQEITSGLRAGDRVVTGPSRTLRGLRDGETIRHEPALPDTSRVPSPGFADT
ncbi:MAG: efflux RND transporter periplasmic adaptor subunit [Gammaproteobacteria bacterium]|nr:efflux RND transporter periplasmic adaptor subunit [Gammaproteobacteria bacterium]